MARASKKLHLIEFKGTTLPVVSVTLHSMQFAALAKAATELFGNEAFFDGDAAVFELDRVDNSDPGNAADAVDWAALRTLFAAHGLKVIGVRGGGMDLLDSAAKAGLPSFAAFKRAPRAAQEVAAAAAVIEIERLPETRPDPAPEKLSALAEAVRVEPAPPPLPTSAPTLVIDRPLRSGQQVYARGGDLVVLAAVNAGAEVIADGSIHIYAPLRGRALAGASGATEARIFTTRFEAELVSIAGVYRTFDAGIPDKLSGRPVQVRLSGTAENAASSLKVESLATD